MYFNYLKTNLCKFHLIHSNILRKVRIKNLKKTTMKTITCILIGYLLVINLYAQEKQNQNNVKTGNATEKDLQLKTTEKYINNSLSTGSTPYSNMYGANSPCSNWGCSQIKVKTPYNSDVLVTIKKGDKVVRHAYIKAGSSYTFEVPDGTYQPFFYYGKGWNPEKIMKQTPDGPLKGGFVTKEEFGKDSPQTLSNNILEYELILQYNGNFSTKPSNAKEAL